MCWSRSGNDSEEGFVWLGWQPSSNRRGRSESAGESSVGGWAWGAKRKTAKSAVELVSGEPRRREPAGFLRFGRYPSPSRVSCQRCRTLCSEERRHEESEGYD